MAIERPISINPGAAGATFDPNPLHARQGDQIFWTNNDTKAHWPGLPGNPGFLMANQIAPGGDVSPVFSTLVISTLNYVCTLHLNEAGSIVIASA